MPLTELLVDFIRTARESGSDPEPAAHGGRVIRQAERASRSSAPVLIQGEAGSGGDSLAHAIHQSGDRKAGPFIRCHAGGTGPSSFAGRVIQAQGGTLLIQGAEDLSADEQSALRRLLQDRDIDGPGARRGLKVDVRIITTSHVEL